MTLRFPRDLVFEAYLGRWVDLTAVADERRLMQTDPVSVSWGSPNEQGKALAPPSTVEGTLRNVGGHWTPGNPMSDYYDYLQGRNVPTRLALRVSRDTFTRTAVGAWGVADTETTAWQDSGVNYTVSVGSGVGTISISAVASFGLVTLGDSYPDCQVALSMPTSSLAFTSVTGAPVEVLNLVQRYQASGTFAGEHYLLRGEIRTDNAVYVAIYHSTLGNLSGFFGPVSDALGALSQNVSLRAKFQAEGQTLRGKIYRGGPSADPDQYEPLGWQVSTHHERLTGGFPGTRVGVAASNTNVKPVTFAHDDWELRLIRHSGELTRLQPAWDTSHRIKTASFKSADVTQRLGRSERPALSTAPRRYMASNLEFTATDFWPFDEAVTGPAQGLNAVAGGTPATFQREFDGVQDRGAVNWGQSDDSLTSVPAFVALNNGGQLTCATRTAALGSVWSVSWAMRLTSDAGAKVFFHTSTTSHFVFFFYTDGTWELFRNPGSVSLMTGSFNLPAGLDGQWVTMGLTVFNNGGGTNVGMRITANGVEMGGSAWSGSAAFSALQSVVLYVPQATTGGQGDGCFSGLVVTNRRLDDVLVFTVTEFITVGIKIDNVLRGWVGERAGARVFRLCAEEGVPLDYWGSLSETRAMGPQRPIALIDQLVECAEADGAFLYAPRYTPGVAFRGRRAMCARSADATLSYSGGMVAPEFATSADDRPTANLVRAERTNGGAVIVEQTAGPMNTADPMAGAVPDPDAVGRSPADVRVNVASDAQLPDVGGWVRALGTTPEVRFPRITVNLRAAQLNDAAGITASLAVLGLHPGDRLLVTGLAAADVYRDLDQIVRGGREVYRNVREHRVTLNTAPYEKYRAGVYDSASSRYDSGGVTTLDAQLTSGTTGARNITTLTGNVWTNDAGAYPLDVLIGGERCTVSGVTGTGTGQVMTISARNVNGLPTAGGKTHPAGTKVVLFAPVYYC